MCTLAIHLNVVLAWGIRFSIFAATLIHDPKSNVNINSLSTHAVESLVVLKNERSTATPAFLTPDIL